MSRLLIMLTGFHDAGARLIGLMTRSRYTHASIGLEEDPGTFYSFFPSKGDFVYAMLMENRQRAVDELEAERVRAGGRAGRDEVRAWMRRMWRAERNIFRIATADEYDYLVRSFPGDRSFEPATDSRLVRWLIDDAADVRPGADAHRVMNLQVALALVLLNRGYMQADALEATVDALIESTLDELFG